MAVVQVKYKGATNQENGAGKRSEISTSLLGNFPLTSVPPPFYCLACVDEILHFLMKNPMAFLTPHLLWLLFIICQSEPVISFKKPFFSWLSWYYTAMCNSKINPYLYPSLLQTFRLNISLSLSLSSCFFHQNAAPS